MQMARDAAGWLGWDLAYLSSYNPKTFFTHFVQQSQAITAESAKITELNIILKCEQLFIPVKISVATKIITHNTGYSGCKLIRIF